MLYHLILKDLLNSQGLDMLDYFETSRSSYATFFALKLKSRIFALKQEDRLFFITVFIQ